MLHKCLFSSTLPTRKRADARVGFNDHELNFLCSSNVLWRWLFLGLDTKLPQLGNCLGVDVGSASRYTKVTSEGGGKDVVREAREDYRTTYVASDREF